MPDNPEAAPLSLLRELLDVVNKYEWYVLQEYEYSTAYPVVTFGDGY